MPPSTMRAFRPPITPAPAALDIEDFSGELFTRHDYSFGYQRGCMRIAFPDATFEWFSEMRERRSGIAERLRQPFACITFLALDTEK